MRKRGSRRSLQSLIGGGKNRESGRQNAKQPAGFPEDSMRDPKHEDEDLGHHGREIILRRSVVIPTMSPRRQHHPSPQDPLQRIDPST